MGAHTVNSPSQTNEVNWNDPLNKGLVAWYPFREKGGNVLHDIAGRHDGDFYKIEPNDWVPCTANGAMALDLDGADGGIDEYVVGPSIERINGATQLTVTAWIAPRQINDGNMGIVGKYITGSNNRSWNLAYSTTNTVRVDLSGDGTFQAANSVSIGAAADSQWRHVAFTYDAATATRLFSGGVLKATNTTRPSSLYVSSKPVIIGMNAYDAYDPIADRTTFNGGISDVRIYDRALSDSEIHDLYQASRTGYRDQFKRRYFPVSTTIEEPPTEETAGGLIRLKSPKQSQPSYKTGYAKSASESAYPELWDGLERAWVPALGNGGTEIRELVTKRQDTIEGTFSDSTWGVSAKGPYVFFDATDSNHIFSTIDPYKPRTIVTLQKHVGVGGVAASISLPSSTSRQWYVGMVANGSAQLGSRSGGSFVNATTVNRVAVNDVCSIVGINYSATKREVYLNGDLANKGDSTANVGVSDSTRLMIGGLGDSTPGYQDSNVLAVLLYDRALSESEIAAIGADPLAPFRQRKSVPYTLTSTPPVQDETSGGLIRLKSTSQTDEVDWNDPLNKGLLIWYPMRQKGGNVLRDAAGENHGTLESSMTSDDWVPSPETKSLALEFDGSNDFVEIPYKAGDAGYPFSIAAWVQPSGTTSAQAVWSVGGSTDSRNRHILYHRGDLPGDPFQAFTEDEGSFNATTSDVETVQNSWHFVVAVFDNATEKRIYVNGDGSSTEPNTEACNPFPVDRHRIARRADSQNGLSFLGAVADFRFYDDRALSESEVHDLYQASRTGYQDQFKRRYFPVSTTIEEPPVEETTGGLIRLKSPSQTNEVDWNDPLNQGLVAWYPMRQKGGNVLRDVVGENHGTLESSMTSDDWVPSPETKSLALDFDGANDYVDCGTGTFGILPGSHEMTLSVWCKIGTFENYPAMLSKTSVAAPYGGWQLNVESTGRFALGFNRSGSWTTVNTSSVFNTNEWYLVTATRWNGGHSIFVNGTLEGQGSGFGTIEYSNAADPVLVGRNPARGETLDGQVSDVRIYNRALTANEVHDLYVASRTGYPTQFKRRYFPVSTTIEEPPTEETAGGLIRLKNPKQTQPSYKAGYAKSASESAYPELWKGLKVAYSPQLGHRGSVSQLDIVEGKVLTRKRVGTSVEDVVSERGIVSEITNAKSLSEPIDWDALGFTDGGFSYFMEVNPSVAGNFTVPLGGEYVSSGNEGFFQSFYRSGFVFRIHGENNTSFIGRASTVGQSTGWKNIACTWGGSGSSSDIAIYFDAVRSDTLDEQSGTFDAAQSTPRGLSIGAQGTAGLLNAACDGQYGTILLYNRALSPSEIALLNADPLAPFRQRKSVPYTPTSTPPVQEETTGNLIRLKSPKPTNEVNWDDPLNKGLIAWYPMRQKGGNVLRDVAGENHGTLNGSMTSDDWVPSPETKSLALDFDGTDDYVSAADSNLDFDINDPFTVSCWSIFTGTTFQLFASKMPASGDYRGWLLGRRATPDFKLIFTLRSNLSNLIEVRSSQDFSFAGRTRLATVTYDGSGSASGVKLYFDGNPVSTTTQTDSLTGTTISPANFNLGGRNDGSNLFEGKLSDTRIYNRALSESEVHDLYVASRTGYRDQFKRRYFPVSTTVEEPPTEETAGGLIRLKSPKQTQPSYKTGYAKSASESAYPELWKGMVGAWCSAINSGKANDAALTNDASFGGSAEWEQKGFRFDGNADYLQATSAVGNVAAGQFSVFSRWRTDLDEDASSAHVVFAYRQSGGNDLIQLNNQTMRPTLQIRSSGTSINEIYGPTLDKGQWHTTVGIYDGIGDVHSLFVNGKIAGTLSLNFAGTISSNEIFIGSYRTTGGADHDGYISDTILWDRKLSPQEIALLNIDPLAPFRQRKSVPYVLTLEEETPDSVITRLGLTATPFKSYTITDKGVVVEDANGRHFLMFVF